MQHHQYGLCYSCNVKRRGVQVGVVVLTLLGLSSTVGYLTHLPQLQQLAKWSAASPLGLAFVSVHGIDTFALQVAYQAYFKDGRERYGKIDAASLAALPSSTQRYQLLQSFTQVTLQQGSQDEAALQQLWQDYFCRQPTLTRSWGWQQTPRMVKLSIGIPHGRWWQVEVICQP